MMDYGGYFGTHAQERNVLDSTVVNPFGINTSLNLASSSGSGQNSMGYYNSIQQQQQQLYGQYASSYGQLTGAARY